MAVREIKQGEFYYDDPIKALWAQKYLGLSFRKPILPEDCCEAAMDFRTGMRIEVKMRGRFWLSGPDVWKLKLLPDDKKRALKLLGLTPEMGEGKDAGEGGE